MNKTIVAAVLLLASASVSYAYTPATLDVNSLSGKAMSEHPGVIGSGTTSRPTAQPDDISISGRVMHDHPGNRGGSKSNQAAKPGDNSLSGKVMKDLPDNS